MSWTGDGGGTTAPRRSDSYATVQRERGGVEGLYHGQTVAIAGEPSLDVYTVLGVDPVHRMALIQRVGGSDAWRLPVAALTPLD